MLRFVEKRGIRTDQTPPRGQKCCQRVERNRSSSPTPAGGSVAKPEITSSGRVTPFLGARETWLAPNVIGAWGVTTLSANLAGDESWVPRSAHLPQVIEITGVTKDMFYCCQIHKLTQISQGMQELTASNSREMCGT